MKFKLPKFAVLGLVIPVFFSALFCCCLTDSLHAQEPEPSCHSTNHKNTTSQNAGDCVCDRSMAVIQNGAVMDMAVVKTVFPAVALQIHETLYAPVFERATQAPPVIYDTSPLYIKHSVLRI